MEKDNHTFHCILQWRRQDFSGDFFGHLRGVRGLGFGTVYLHLLKRSKPSSEILSNIFFITYCSLNWEVLSILDTSVKLAGQPDGRTI